MARASWNPVEHYKSTNVARTYDQERFTSLAGRTFNRLEKRLISRAFRSVPIGATIGDVPCGTGRLAETLLDDGHIVIGVDISSEMLDVAKSRFAKFGAQFSTRSLDARALPTSDLRFDAALCARVLKHFPLEEQIAFLKGVASVTKGPIVFTQGLNTAYNRLRRRIKRWLGQRDPSSNPLTERELESLLQGAGLREVARYYVLPFVSESVVIVSERTTGRAQQ